MHPEQATNQILSQFCSEKSRTSTVSEMHGDAGERRGLSGRSGQTEVEPIERGKRL